MLQAIHLKLAFIHTAAFAVHIDESPAGQILGGLILCKKAAFLKALTKRFHKALLLSDIRYRYLRIVSVLRIQS
jgi:hypothetical protein